jgi:hypothetical protein
MEYSVFDIETKGWDKIYAIGIYDGVNLKIFTEKQKNNDGYIEWLLDNLKDGDIVYAHNGGRFDFLFVIEYMKNNKIKPFNFNLIHGSVAMFTIKYKDKRITFKDSMLILPFSLRQLTNDFDVKHKKLEMDYELGLEDERFNDYFANDLYGLYEVLEQVPELRSKLTIASNCINVFRNIFYKQKFTRNNYNVNELFRKGYFGGRTEIFKLYGTKLYYYDINSLYPYVMSNFKYPLPIRDNYTKVFKYNGDGYYFIKAEIDNKYIPVLPYRMQKSKKLIFPLGKFSGWYYSPEIELAKQEGYKIKVYKGYSFNKVDYLFKDYVDYYYKIKKNSSGAKKAVAKLMLNSLYGKFGQHDFLTSYSFDYDKKDEVEWGKAYSPLFNMKEKKYLANQDFVHPEISGMITSYARVTLYNLFKRADFDVYYCDTDSIFTSKLLKTSNALGDIKEEAQVKEFVALAPKVYAYTDMNDGYYSHIKGMRKGEFGYDVFKKALYTQDMSEFKMTFDRLASFKEAKIHHRNTYTTTNILVKTLKSVYDKRKIQRNYWDTYPLTVKE